MLTHCLHLAQLLLILDGHVVELLLLLVEFQLKLAVLLLFLSQVGSTALLLLVQLHVFAVHDLRQLVDRLTIVTLVNSWMRPFPACIIIVCK